MKLPSQSLPEPLPADPLAIALSWLQQATSDQVQPNPNAMVLATVDATGRPSARVVLCKEIVPHPGYLVFYTNYLSRKGREIEATGRGSVVFHWDVMHRQVRIEGRIVRAPESDSDDYFASRNWRSRVGAWASQQSQPISSREELVHQVRAAATRLGAPDPLSAADDDAAPEFHLARPPHWGGYRLWADAVELWVEGDHRIHDRARWERTLDDTGRLHGGPWSGTRLQP